MSQKGLQVRNWEVVKLTVRNMISNSLRIVRNNSSSAAENLNNGFGGFGKREGETPEMKGEDSLTMTARKGR
jgi:hypothetical protein